MGNWLFKTEPNVYSVGDLARSTNQICTWDGIRNYQARNFLRDSVKHYDRVFLYHCQCPQPGIYGIAHVHRAGYPDPAQFDPASAYFDPKALSTAPRWYCVDLQLQHLLISTPLLLPEIKQHSELTQLGLFKQPRLSVVPITENENELLTTLIQNSN